MEVLYERCARLDVHQKSVVVTVLVTTANGRVTKCTRTFGTMTAGLLALDSWLDEQQVEQLAMESTGVYWYPVYNRLEEGRGIVLVNPQHMKAVPGHKTDVKDSEWMADLLRHGLLKPSFIPPQPIRALRELTRYRKRLVQERTQAVNHLQKVLESANIKVGTIATDLLGVGGRAMLEALIADDQSVVQMAQLARGAATTGTPLGPDMPGEPVP